MNVVYLLCSYYRRCFRICRRAFNNNSNINGVGQLHKYFDDYRDYYEPYIDRYNMAKE